MIASYRIVILLFFFAAAPALAAEEGLIEPLSAPQTLPALEYGDGGATHALETKGAKLTALHFWATWCVPCVEELPEIDKTATTYKEKGFKVVALSLDANMDKVKKFFTDHGIVNLTPYLDPKTAAYRTLKLKGLPTTVFVNEKGEAIAQSSGPVDWMNPKTKTFIESQLK